MSASETSLVQPFFSYRGVDVVAGEARARAPFKRVGLKLQRPVRHCPAFAAGRLQNSPAAADSQRDPEPANHH